MRHRGWFVGCGTAVIAAFTWFFVADRGQPDVRMEMYISKTSSGVNALIEVTNRNERHLHSCIVEVQTGPQELPSADWTASNQKTVDLSSHFELAPYEKKGWTVPLAPLVQHFGVVGSSRCGYYDWRGTWKTLVVSFRH